MFIRVIRVPVDTLCRDGTGQISYVPHKKIYKGHNKTPRAMVAREMAGVNPNCETVESIIMSYLTDDCPNSTHPYNSTSKLIRITKHPIALFMPTQVLIESV